MENWFLERWAEAAMTTLGFFWTAFWAFGLGYLISSAIQLFVGRDRMRRSMGDGARGIGLGALFGFISSSCSFAALASTRSLFAKGAGFAPSMAFLLASTNLVVELGIVIAIFLGWEFVVGEYLGGMVLILLVWLLIRLTGPRKLIEAARRRAGAGGEESAENPRRLLSDLELWGRLARAYLMEWGMVWKDVTVGFTVAGVVAAFVPPAFFAWLFPGSGESGETAPLDVLIQALVGPVAAFFTFIGSMGNIPLAGILFQNGVSIAGVMAFIFSDLVVLPVLRVNAQYYGWRMALYILAIFLAALVTTALLIHYGFHLAGIAPEPPADTAGRADPAERFAIDYTFWLNMGFIALTLAFFGLSRKAEGGHRHDHGGGSDWVETLLFWLAVAAYGWLAAGVALWLQG